MTSIEIAITGVDAGLLDPYEVVGREAISSLYTFDIACDLLGDPPGSSILGSHVTLTLTTASGTRRVITGMVGGVRIETNVVSSRPASLHVRLVPQMARLRLTRQNHVFGPVEAISVDQIIARQMSGHLYDGNRVAQHEAVLRSTMRLRTSYPKQNQVVQFEESNLDFMARQAERWGIFWFFEASEAGETAVFADHNISVPWIDGSTSLDWHGWHSGMTPQGDDTIQALDATLEPVSKAVVLNSYNYLTPSVDLLTTMQVDPEGDGVWTDTCERFETVADGQLFARLRAELLEARKFRLSGRSSVVRLAAGRAFELRDHPFEDWNQSYLVVSVDHTARVARPGRSFGPDAAMGYSNRFVIQPLSVPFRPERVTPRPKMPGVMQGFVESAVHGGDLPYLDGYGRYRVRLAYDLSNSPSGSGSRWMRKMSQLAGPQEGMHFPLRAGTEVMVVHVNGDPDRPVIVAAVFNRATPNVVTSADADQNQIHFRRGMGITAQSRSRSPTTANSK